MELGGSDINGALKHYGMSKEIGVNIRGVEENLLQTVYDNFYNPSEHERDPFKTNKNYGSQEAVKMLFDIEEYSKTEEKYDSKGIVVGKPNKKAIVSSEVYNLIISEGLRGTVFKNLGDDMILCLRKGGIAILADIDENDYSCRTKLRSHPRGLAYKVPGFKSFTGYKYAEHFNTDVIMSMTQLRSLIDEVYLRYNYVKENFNKKLIDFPKSSYNIPKTNLLIKLSPNAKKHQRNLLKNNLLNFAKDDSMVAFDGVTFMKDIEERMGMLDFFNLAISLVCFALGFFQLIVSISANIRDSMWELGVLRAIGMTNKEIMKITIYESMANNISSILLGFVIGLIISVSIVG